MAVVEQERDHLNQYCTVCVCVQQKAEVTPLAYLAVSLVPRLFPPPVFDHLQYANTEGEGLGDLVMCSTLGRQSIDTWGFKILC